MNVLLFVLMSWLLFSTLECMKRCFMRFLSFSSSPLLGSLLCFVGLWFTSSDRLKGQSVCV